jgi:hypothetical protein
LNKPKSLAFFGPSTKSSGQAHASVGQLCVEKNARAFYFYKAIERLYVGNFILQPFDKLRAGKLSTSATTNYGTFVKNPSTKSSGQALRSKPIISLMTQVTIIQ